MIQLHGAAPVFVVVDVLRSVDYYRDALGFDTEFLYGEPTFYAGVERDNVLIHLQAARESTRQAGQAAMNVWPKDYAYGMRDFNIADLDGNELCFGMESKR
jgi:catechol 2,3-dioxygenase-like lactoylglutathione lyase family enzyme